MLKIAPVCPNMSLLELQNNVKKDFFTFIDPPLPAVLSYWSPNTKELVIRLTTPPVILTNDGAVSFFFHHLASPQSINLFVILEPNRVKHQSSQVDENSLHLSNVCTSIKQNLKG
ncbi:hypothetical protein HID58_059267 [Brassica napus]|uniref:Uncharacterized protein n=1 Tax=Brassica napus TaxID=3708 RepID=A0ABQ7ZSE2_BRANA|nr:hypothetical protein HID58_059267 [Brassica napus]